MAPRKTTDTTPENVKSNVHEQFDDLAAQQMNLCTLVEQNHQELKMDMDQRQTKMLHMIQALKTFLDGLQLHQKGEEKFSSIQFKGIITTYWIWHSRLLAQCSLTNAQAIFYFLGGLKEELVGTVLMHEPQTLSRTYRLAMSAEAAQMVNARAQKSEELQKGTIRKQPIEPHIRSQVTYFNQDPRLAFLGPTRSCDFKSKRTISPAEM
ncbi:hypothetical protein HAX54_042594 [Datura stramonium]|uniref:Uncharacterized protein n=1 Tax=Datura stramonium TaxID=4076 RepID=A0ABS8RQY1_DATST|nr:hypothetical protein [Datura stramonium]